MATPINPNQGFDENFRSCLVSIVRGLSWDPNVLHAGTTARQSVLTWQREMRNEAIPVRGFLPREEKSKILEEVLRFGQELGTGKRFARPEDLPSPEHHPFIFKQYFPILAAAVLIQGLVAHIPGDHRQLNRIWHINDLLSEIRTACGTAGGPTYQRFFQHMGKRLLVKASGWLRIDYEAVTAQLAAMVAAIRQKDTEILGSSILQDHTLYMAIYTYGSLGQLHHRQQVIYGVSQPAFARQLAARGMRSF
ncbi:hypothetical protein JCM10207_009286 [Rhodosporidiobolus poonsookiae]